MVQKYGTSKNHWQKEHGQEEKSFIAFRAQGCRQAERIMDRCSETAADEARCGEWTRGARSARLFFVFVDTLALDKKSIDYLTNQPH